jgi:hypothetical protein
MTRSLGGLLESRCEVLNLQQQYPSHGIQEWFKGWFGQIWDLF